VNIYGLKIWQEEFSRMVNFNVEQESNQFVKRKIMDWQSEFQSEAVPIPRFSPLEDGYACLGLTRVINRSLNAAH
jgi:WASH complex subunit strumpellin